MDFEDFWNPPPPPPDNSDNNGVGDTPPSSPPPPLPPAEPAKSGTGGQGGTDFAESLKQRNSGGVQGGTGGQGIGFDSQKNAVCVLEKTEVEISATSVLEGGHPDGTPDSYKVTQSVAKSDSPACDTAPLDQRDNDARQEVKDKPLTLPLIIKVLETVQTLEELEALENRASEQGFDQKIWKPLVWPHLTEDTQCWLRVLNSRRKPTSNPDLEFCFNALSALEAPGHPAISSEDELVHLFQQIENRGQRCELPNDFWNRASAARGLIAASLTKQKAPIGERCLIQRIGGTLLNPFVEWVEALMVDEPNPPTQKHYVFELADGRRVAVSGEDEWRLIDG